MFVDHRGNPIPTIRNLAREGATKGKRATSLYAPRLGPNRAVVPDQHSLRDRTLAGYRNMPLVFSGIEKKVLQAS